VTPRPGHAGRVLRRSWIFTRLSREGRAVLAMASSVLPFGVSLGRDETYLLVLATLALLAASLLVSSAYRAQGLVVVASVPARVPLGDELCVALELGNGGGRELRQLRVEPPPLGYDGRLLELPADVERLAPGERRRVQARLRFKRRGTHQLAPFRVAQLLPLELAQGAASKSLATSFLVVPRVACVTAVGAARSRRQQLAGLAGASRVAEASDLAGVRPYRAGDALRELHARSWARHGVPMVRQYRENHSARLGVVVDTDASLQSEAAFEAGLSLAAGIVARLSEGEQLADLLVTAERAERLALGRQCASLERALDLLATLQRSPGFQGERLLEQLAPHLGGLSCVVLVALGWDEARAALLARLEACGTSTLAYVLTEQVEPGPRPAWLAHAGRVRGVPIGAIARGEELLL